MPQASLTARESSSVPVANVGRVLVQLAHLDGPLKLVAPAQPADPATFSQHMQALASQLNTLHDPKTLGGYMNAANFKRAKYELFALQHMQLLVWLQRVQTGLAQGVGSAKAAIAALRDRRKNGYSNTLARAQRCCCP